VLKARRFGKGRFLVGSADVIVKPGLWKRLWGKKGFDAVVALREEARPKRFGAALLEGEKLVQIVEKPGKKMKSGLVNAGCYLFNQRIFPVLKGIKISSRGEFELTDAINKVAGKGRAGFVVYKGKCLDIGTVAELKKAEKKG